MAMNVQVSSNPDDLPMFYCSLGPKSYDLLHWIHLVKDCRTMCKLRPFWWHMSWLSWHWHWMVYLYHNYTKEKILSPWPGPCSAVAKHQLHTTDLTLLIQVNDPLFNSEETAQLRKTFTFPWTDKENEVQRHEVTCLRTDWNISHPVL